MIREVKKNRAGHIWSGPIVRKRIGSVYCPAIRARSGAAAKTFEPRVR